MDSYALCPCGSGKKVKFCCQAILPEMAKIERLQENNQLRMALQLIDKLRKEHPDNAWLATRRAMVLFSEGELVEARDSLVGLLHTSPDHPLANGLLAVVMSELEPFDKARKVIHRAFLKCMSAEPRIINLLAKKMAAYYLDHNAPMAARQHLAMALRLEDQEEHQRIIVGMLELDSDQQVLSPLRGGHPLPQFNPPAAQQAAYKKAHRLAGHGCFAEAADQLEPVTAAESTDATLQHQIGLLRAWDADHARAIAAFRAASKLTNDFESSVELELLAQSLELDGPEQSVEQSAEFYTVDSLSRLLTRFDNDDRLVRYRDRLNPETGVAAVYAVLDRPQLPENEWAGLNADNCPRVLGEVSLFDSIETTPPTAIVSAFGDSQFAAVKGTFESVAGELAVVQPEEPSEDDEALPRTSLIETRLDAPLYPPRGVSEAIRALLSGQSQTRLVESWLNMPLPALQGQTPRQAAGNESLKVSLAAALRVAEAVFDRRGYTLDVTALSRELQLPTPVPPTEEALRGSAAIGVARLQQLDLRSLSDDVFEMVLQRSQVVRNSTFSEQALMEFVNHREDLKKQNGEALERAYFQLSQLSARKGLVADGRDWLERGFQWLKANGGTFEQQLTWRLREFVTRAQLGVDESLKALMLELWNYYGAKAPAIRPQLEEFARSMGLETPWTTSIITPEMVPAGGASWSGESAAAGGGEKKLWLPE